jgi:hypothetical protein
MDNQIKGTILPGGIIKLTTDLISDRDLHIVAEEFVKNVERDSGGTFKVVSNKSGKVHTHTHADGSQTTHQH